MDTRHGHITSAEHDATTGEVKMSNGLTSVFLEVLLGVYLAYLVTRP
ncbi:hypothetical protein [Mycobacterium sp. JS623]|nr:hypothetical protein [Mycobacterium sp. JS623]